MLIRLANDLSARVGGPMTFRFILQPLVAVIFGTLAGLRDARGKRSPFLWLLVSDSSLRRGLVRDGWTDIARVFIAAIVIDFVYQLIVVGWFYPLEALVVAALVAIFPYIIVRALANRLARRFIT